MEALQKVKIKEKLDQNVKSTVKSLNILKCFMIVEDISIHFQFRRKRLKKLSISKSLND